MKRNLLFSMLLICSGAFLWMSHDTGAGKVQKKDRTGGPVAEGTCANCHIGGNTFATVTKLSIRNSMGDTVTNYVPGTTYKLTVSVKGTGAKVYGYQMVSLLNDNSSTGTFSNFGTQQQISPVAGRNYLEQKSESTTGDWTMDWQAPVSGSGDVSFYLCGLAANNASGSSGDLAKPITALLPVATNTNQINDLSGLKILSYYGNEVPIIIETLKGGMYEFEIYSMNGVLISKTQTELTNGTNNLSLDASAAPNGAYVLSVRHAGQMQSQRFIKL